MEELNFIVRWGHLLFGITWVGMLYYFNFVQGGYFKSASPEGLADAKAKLAPNALWWFRWAAMFTFISGFYLLAQVGRFFNDYIAIGALLGTIMFLNVWFVIWPAQRIALGMKEGDAPAAAAKALLASRTNTLFSAPMAYCMLASAHKGYGPDHLIVGSNANGGGLGLWVALVIVTLLEINALYGKQGPLASINGVIYCSLALTALLISSLVFL